MFKATAVIHLRHRILVGHLLGANHVMPAQRDAVDAGLARGLVHQALHDVDRFGPARAAVGADRGGVGQDRLEVEINGLDVIDAGLYPGADQQLNGHTGAGGIGAHIGQRVHAQGQNPAIRCQRQLGLAVDIAARGAAEKLFAAVSDPFHWAFQRPGTPGRHRVFRVNAAFHAKAAADVTHRHPHLVARQAQDVFAQGGLDAGWHLGAHAHQQPAINRVH